MIIQPKPCPHCNGENIDINVKVITRIENGIDRLQAWAFCRNSGHRGLSAIGRFSEMEAKEGALRMWNDA